MADRSPVLPSDPFDIRLAELINSNGTHIQPVCIQHMDDYGNTTVFTVQTVRTDRGATVFLSIVRGEEARKYILPPKVLGAIDRQREQATKVIRRRHGQRLAEARQASGTVNPFTPEMRAKALATRKRKAALRAKRRKGA